MAKSPNRLWRAVITVVVSCLTTAASTVHAAELTLLSPQAMRAVLDDLIPQFERSTGNQVAISYGTASILVKEIEDGKIADAAILFPQQIRQLQNEGKIVANSLTPIGQLEYGLFIRKGEPKPDIRRVHGLKQALLSATSIAAGDPITSSTGNYFANLIERLQIADAIKPKIKTVSSGTAALEAVANGEADLGVSVIVGASAPGVDLAGVLPAQAKKSNSYAIGILTTSEQIQVAKALVAFLSSPNSQSVMRSKGFNAP